MDALLFFWQNYNFQTFSWWMNLVQKWHIELAKTILGKVKQHINDKLCPAKVNVIDPTKEIY